MTVGENIDFAAGLHRLERGYAVERRRKLFDFIGIDRPLSSMVGSLPGGIKQEIALAAAMLHDPEIIFLDEPTAGVSPSSRMRFWKLIKRVAASGKTVMVTTHYMDEAENCSRIALMRAGRIIALDSPEALKKSAFSGPLAEVDFKGAVPSGFMEALKSAPGFGGASPYGLLWHIFFDSAENMRAAFSSMPPSASVSVIRPSLEDVFIRLVEGSDR